jgi:alpha-beta hydrolase superfamily lysophospholipase
VHGLAEHAARYRDIASTFASRGISCFVYDQRGHGQQPGVRTHVPRFDDFVTDLRTVGRAINARYPRLPLYIWGHSMGTIVAMLAAVRPDPWLRGVITSSNSLEVFRRGLNPLSGFFRVASQVAPRIRIPLGLDGAKISRDETVQRAYMSDPLIARTASLRLIVEFAAACERARSQAAQLQLPWLVVHGEHDEIAPSAGSHVLFELLGAADKKLVTYPGARHEVHNESEPDRTAALNLLTDWILERGRNPNGAH